MCIRDRVGVEALLGQTLVRVDPGDDEDGVALINTPLDVGVCLLYTSDAADDLLCVDLGGRRILKKKNTTKTKQKNR